MATYEARRGKVINKTYIVLGTGRSGTSFITDCLMSNNVKMGKSSGKGFHLNLENLEFRQLNKDILLAAGGDAFNPPSIENVLKQKGKFDKKALKLINKYKDNLWGFKDPRTALALPAYLHLFDGDVYFICMFRKLDKVIQSIIDNDGSRFDNNQAEQLVKKYLNSILYLIKKFSF